MNTTGVLLDTGSLLLPGALDATASGTRWSPDLD
jgi:hypothetical protein